MEIKPISINDQRPPKEIIKQWWPSAYDEFDANPGANSLPIWVVACLLYPAHETVKIIEKSEELLYLCQNLRISCEGDPFDRYEEYIINPLVPEIKGKRYITGLYAKLSKETVSRHLQQYREWPLAADVPLSKWWGHHFESPLIIEQPQGKVDKQSPEIENAEGNSIESPEESVINFAKTVLMGHPGATTADLRRYCFDEMTDLHSRDRAVINRILIKAGAIKSKIGVHATKIDWKDKYPKTQWMRVFQRNKSSLNQ